MVSIAVLVISLFTVSIVWMAWSTARRDLLAGGFILFFLIYVDAALIGYHFAPVIPSAMGVYFGPEWYVRYLIFIWMSFLGLYLSHRTLAPLIGARHNYLVVWRPTSWRFVSFFVVIAAYTMWMGVMFLRLYDHINWASIPQIPNKPFAIAFKSIILPMMVVWAIARNHCRSTTEKAIAFGSLFGLLVIFIVTAIKSGNRTDLLALGLGIGTYELAPVLANAHNGLHVDRWGRLIKRLVVVSLGFAVLLGIAAFIRRSREVSDTAAQLPLWVRLLVNDYYAPAQILFASMAWHIVEPARVLKSNLTNALYLGGILHVPYLQDNIGNMLSPGSSSRSTGYGLYIFAEGYLALGWYGIVYNAVIPALGILSWSRLARSTERSYNALVLALGAMFWADIARSGTFLLVRTLLFSLIPTLLLFRYVTGARLVSQRPTERELVRAERGA